MSFILGNIKCENGKKEKGYWNIEKTNYHIPITIICGKQEGKTIVISSGVHSCEYVGIQAAIEIAQELSPNNISGTVIILHPVNYTGFFKRLPAVMPEDNKNLNRVFPGNKDGTLSEKIAYSFSKNLYPNIDFFFDLHGGDVQENVMPFVYFSGSADENIKEISIEAAKSLSVPYRVKSSSVNGVYSLVARVWALNLHCKNHMLSSKTRSLYKFHRLLQRIIRDYLCSGSGVEMESSIQHPGYQLCLLTTES